MQIAADDLAKQVVNAVPALSDAEDQDHPGRASTQEQAQIVGHQPPAEGGRERPGGAGGLGRERGARRQLRADHLHAVERAVRVPERHHVGEAVDRAGAGHRVAADRLAPRESANQGGPSRRSGVVIGAIIGLVLGLLAAIFWEPVATQVRSHQSDVACSSLPACSTASALPWSCRPTTRRSCCRRRWPGCPPLVDRVIVVDDASTDGTAAAARAAAEPTRASSSSRTSATAASARRSSPATSARSRSGSTSPA